MMLTEDKISHLSHVLLKGLLEKDLIEAIEDEGKIRAEIRGGRHGHYDRRNAG
jgi:hypothetical protein